MKDTDDSFDWHFSYEPKENGKKVTRSKIDTVFENPLEEEILSEIAIISASIVLIVAVSLVSCVMIFPELFKWLIIN